MYLVICLKTLGCWTDLNVPHRRWELWWVVCGLSHLPIWHLTGFSIRHHNPESGFYPFELSVYFLVCFSLVSLQRKTWFMAMIINQNQPGALCFALYCCMIAYTAGQLIGHMVYMAMSWGNGWDPAKSHVLLLWHRAVIFQTDQGPRAKRNLDFGLQIHSHRQCSVKRVKQVRLPVLRQGTMLV